jgi:hypothetical protein
VGTRQKAEGKKDFSRKGGYQGGFDITKNKLNKLFSRLWIFTTLRNSITRLGAT